MAAGFVSKKKKNRFSSCIYKSLLVQLIRTNVLKKVDVRAFHISFFVLSFPMEYWEGLSGIAKSEKTVLVTLFV